MTKKKQQNIEELKEQLATNPDESIYIKQPEFELIRFDKKVNTYIAVCVLLYFIFVCFKWHNSSIPFWSQNVNDGGNADRGLIAGKTLPVRSDEWLVTSSFIVAQEKKNFPVTNEALGYGKTPLIMGLPANHVLSMLKPHLWGYYILDNERAFSWHWNFKIFPFLIASFLLLMLFTKNNFIISLFGSVWLFLSSAIQWWSINTEIFTYGFLIIISLIYILYSDKKPLILLNGFIFLLSSYSFSMILYPAYQVPLAYFMLALIIGYVMNRKSLQLLSGRKLFKFSVLACSLLLLLLLAYLFYKECKDTIQVISNTVYPGKRNESGGNFPFISMFKDNFSWLLNDSYFPVRWGNICELSSYLMLSPVVSILVIYSYIKTKKINPLFIPLLFFQVFIYLWFFKGFPEFLSRLTLFNTSPTHRTFFVFGFSNVVFTLLYLGQFRNTEEKTGTWKDKAVSFIIIFIIAFGINKSLNKQADSFFSTAQIFNAAILFSALNWLVIYFKESKTFQYLFFVSCFFFVASNTFINPLSRGLSPYLENKVYKTVSEIKEKEPEAGWVVFGSFVYANFLKAAGINCFNGVQFAPPLEKLHLLDPSLKNDSVYNRYAHIAFSAMMEENDPVKFSLNQADLYSIQMDPCSPRFKKMGIKYFMFSYKPAEAEVRCMQSVKDTCGFYIFKQNN